MSIKIFPLHDDNLEKVLDNKISKRIFLHISDIPSFINYLNKKEVK